MPRIRSIKPQFWLDENLGTIPRDARLLYIGLWNLADDQGVFEWRPARIKVQLFPYDADVTTREIEQWLKLLVDTRDTAKFEHDGHSFGYIRSFLKHQDIKHPSKWTFAPIPEKLKANSTPAVGEPYPSPIPALPLGSRLKGKGVGSREKEKTTASPEFLEIEFDEYIEELKAEFSDVDFENEFKKFKLYWSEGGRKLKRPKLALRNWMEKAREIKAEKAPKSRRELADLRLERWGGSRNSLINLILKKTKKGISKSSKEGETEIKRLINMSTEELLVEIRRLKL